MPATVTIERIEKYFETTEQARARLSTMLKMCDDYAADARHFANEGDLVSAFGAINYAHAWLDAAVKIGLMDGHGDDRLFTLP